MTIGRARLSRLPCVRGSSCSSPPAEPAVLCVRPPLGRCERTASDPGAEPLARVQRSCHEARALSQLQPSAHQPAGARVSHVWGRRQPEHPSPTVPGSRTCTAAKKRRPVLHELHDAAADTVTPSSTRPVSVPPSTQDCVGCGHSNRGVCDPFFRCMQFVCSSCGSTWTVELTAEQRWALLHGSQH